ncbi:hypothetical protein [Lacunisphaera limnophila]|nr:hypothetical protein [Lacunisphaera limnophila]
MSALCLPQTLPSTGELRGKRPGIDSGLDAIRFARTELAAEARGEWVRLRSVDLSKEHETRHALHQLRAAGWRTCMMLRLSVKDWKTKYLPEDLRESYTHSRKLGVAFGDLMDAWEVDNEPDLGFVPELPERYAAFLKTYWLGLKEGIKEAKAKPETGNLKPEFSSQDSDLHAPATSGFRSQVSGFSNVPLVLMGSLGLPPGPWLERFAANDGFAYTDGYNYHYYGYADDFTGVYRQHETAVRQLSEERIRLLVSAPSTQQPATNTLRKKHLSVFLTEIGYGMLNKKARNTKEGRLRQWRWFRSVGTQISKLNIEGPMAFYLLPFLEYDQNEYGLTVAPGSAVASNKVQVTSDKLGQSDAPAQGDLPRKSAGGIEYAVEDFGVNSAEAWMEKIGSAQGGNEYTPALAWWMAAPRSAALGVRSDAMSGLYTGNRRTSQEWAVNAPTPSPVVIDFLPGKGLQPVKRYNGHFVVGITAEAEPGAAISSPPPTVKPAAMPSRPERSEESMVQIRMQSGNLFEVYPTRLVTPAWQHYLEPHDNFTAAFYCRGELPWRLAENKPASLVFVLYPRQLPLTLEIRRPQVLKLGTALEAQDGAVTGGARRYGQGQLVLYNYSDKQVTGRLEPSPANAAQAPGLKLDLANEKITLAPLERRVVEMTLIVQAMGYERYSAEVVFTPDDAAIPPARIVTDFIPDIGGMKSSQIASLLPPALSAQVDANLAFIASRPRVPEEERGMLAFSNRILAPEGAKVENTPDGLRITFAAMPEGSVKKREIEIPWPEGLEFGSGRFLSLEYRLVE